MLIKVKNSKPHLTPVGIFQSQQDRSSQEEAQDLSSEGPKVQTTKKSDR